ncbi:MAG: hypothetical protein H3C58_01100 [Fimbriimonadaceae bacterium]|nr:hypothetical protein [Fimbriimonadaceae bacterium]
MATIGPKAIARSLLTKWGPTLVAAGVGLLAFLGALAGYVAYLNQGMFVGGQAKLACGATMTWKRSANKLVVVIKNDGPATLDCNWPQSEYSVFARARIIGFSEADQVAIMPKVPLGGLKPGSEWSRELDLSGMMLDEWQWCEGYAWVEFSYADRLPSPDPEGGSWLRRLRPLAKLRAKCTGRAYEWCDTGL